MQIKLPEILILYACTIVSHLDRLHLEVSDWSWEFSSILEHTSRSLAFDNLQIEIQLLIVHAY